MTDKNEKQLKKEKKVREKRKYHINSLKRCLTRDVYSRITVQDVADESKVSKGGLLYYFPTKEEMYLELMEDLFNEIETDHTEFLLDELDSGIKANISVLYGIEKFVQNLDNIKILINLILYAYEEEKIMVPLKEFMRKHLNLYIDIIKEARSSNPARRKTDFNPHFTGRIAQTLILSIGLLESIDPVELDPRELVEYIRALFRG
jgi:AcrR family transcriptional regulator